MTPTSCKLISVQPDDLERVIAELEREGRGIIKCVPPSRRGKAYTLLVEAPKVFDVPKPVIVQAQGRHGVVQ